MKHPKPMAHIMNELLAKFHFLHKRSFLTKRIQTEYCKHFLKGEGRKSSIWIFFGLIQDRMWSCIWTLNARMLPRALSFDCIINLWSFIGVYVGNKCFYTDGHLMRHEKCYGKVGAHHFQLVSTRGSKLCLRIFDGIRNMKNCENS